MRWGCSINLWDVSGSLLVASLSSPCLLWAAFHPECIPWVTELAVSELLKSTRTLAQAVKCIAMANVETNEPNRNPWNGLHSLNKNSYAACLPFLVYYILTALYITTWKVGIWTRLVSVHEMRRLIYLGWPIFLDLYCNKAVPIKTLPIIKAHVSLCLICLPVYGRGPDFMNRLCAFWLALLTGRQDLPNNRKKCAQDVATQTSLCTERGILLFPPFLWPQL